MHVVVYSDALCSNKLLSSVSKLPCMPSDDVLLCAEYAFTMKVTEKRDVYSFGVVLLELLTGQSLIQLLEKGRDLVNLVRRTMNRMTSTSKVFGV